MKRFACALSIVILAAALGPAAPAWGDDAPLTNAEVVKLCKSGLGDKVVLAKIKEAAQVDFKTGADDLVKLKGDGCSSTVIEAMLDRSGGGGASSGGGKSATTASTSARNVVKLITAGGEVQLSSIHGTRQQIVAPFVGWRHFMVYKEVKADTRIKDRKPSILIETNDNPVDQFFVVTVNQDDDDNDRSVDLLSPGVWGGRIGDAPEGDAQLDYDAKQERPGVWRLTLRKDLKPGEYGVYSINGDLYDFGVDK